MPSPPPLISELGEQYRHLRGQHLKVVLQKLLTMFASADEISEFLTLHGV